MKTKCEKCGEYSVDEQWEGDECPVCESMIPQKFAIRDGVKQELSYILPDRRWIWVVRQSNRTLLVYKDKSIPIMDTDQSIITDENGHRYSRQIDMEHLCEGYYYYSMI